jgi:hypothetical protein
VELRNRLGNVQSARRVIFCILLFFAAIASFAGYYTPYGFNDDDPVMGFVAVIDGTANRPYVYRQLLPTVANWANQRAPKSLLNTLSSMHGETKGIYSIFNSRVVHEPAYAFRYLVFYLEGVLAAITAVAFLYLACRVEGHIPLVSLTASTFMILLMPYLMIRGRGYYSDYPELAFLAAGVWAARRLHWPWLIPIVVLGTFNKESYIVIVLTFWPLLLERASKLYSLLQIAILECFAVGVYLMVRSRFRGNGGGTTEFHLWDQFEFFAHPANWLFEPGLAYRMFVPKAMTLIPAALLIWIVWIGSKRLSIGIRRHGMIALALNLPLYVLFCDPGEVRDLGMLYVAFMLCVAGVLSASADGLVPPVADNTIG